MDAVKAAKEAEYAARRALEAIEALRNDEMRRAKEAIYERYAQQMQDAHQRINDAYLARRAAEDNLPAHEWEGKRVYRIEGSGRWGQRTVRIEGIVETVRSWSKFPENTGSYRIPNIGEPIVRMLKKDGSPSLKFKPFDPGHNPWLADGEPA